MKPQINCNCVLQTGLMMTARGYMALYVQKAHAAPEEW